MSTVIGAPDLSRRAGARAGSRWRRPLEAWQTAEPLSPPDRSEWPAALHWALGLGLAAILLQLIALCAWSAFEVHRFALTPDFTTFAQPLALIWRGDLSPYLTVWGHPFIADHGVFLEYLLAPLVRLGPHAVLIKWAQAAALAGAEALALLWLAEIIAAAADRLSARTGALLLGAGALVLVADPWTFWAEGFDAHAGTFAALWTVGALRALALGRRSLWLWFAAGLLAGDVSTSYQLGVGAAGLLRGRSSARTGLLLLVIAAGWYEGLQAAGLTQGTGAGSYADLLGRAGSASAHRFGALSLLGVISTHPDRLLRVLGENAGRLWANLSPAGAVGLLYLPVLPVAVIALAESQLTDPSAAFSQAGFQSAVLYPLVALGTLALAVRLMAGAAAGRRAAGRVLVALLCANAIAWAVIWLPQLTPTWVRVPAPAARTLAAVQRRIGPEAEVIVSQGEIGAFADRRWVYPVSGTLALPRRARSVWFIITPSVGIETVSVGAADGLISRLISMPGVQEIADAHGVWAFRWTPPPSLHTIRLSAPRQVPAWTVSGPAATVVRAGPPADWFVASNGKTGYVVAHDYFREPPGTYTATARLAASGPVRLELWNADSSTLLARTDFPGANTPVTVSVTGVLTHLVRPHGFSGFGPWSEQGPLPAGGNQLELRVWSPGGNDAISVYHLELRRDGGP